MIDGNTVTFSPARARAVISVWTGLPGLEVNAGRPIYVDIRIGGHVVCDAEMANINIKHAEFHGEWNYIIAANNPPAKSRVYFLTRP